MAAPVSDPTEKTEPPKPKRSFLQLLNWFRPTPPPEAEAPPLAETSAPATDPRAEAAAEKSASDGDSEEASADESDAESVASGGSGSSSEGSVRPQPSQKRGAGEAKGPQQKQRKARRRQRQKSEALAKAALASKDFSFERVFAVLEAVGFPMNKTRKNVLPEGLDGVQGMVLGLYVFAHKVGYSDASKKNPCLVQLLAKFARAAHPDFQFTSIQVNKNYAARPHVDKNNLGNSFIAGLGHYEGGELWLHDDEGPEPLELKENIRSMHHYRSGVTYPGRIVDIRHRWQSFDGNRLHSARPFRGTRYSLVYFTCDRFKEAPPEVRRTMASAGFAFGWASQQLEDALTEKQQERKRRRDQVEVELKAILREKRQKVQEEMGPCMARTWNRGWGGDCPRFKHKDCGDFCQMHVEVWKTHGRVDGEVPPAKRREMERWQETLSAKGEKPPEPLPRGAILLVPVP